MSDVAPPGFSARRRGGSLAFRLELTTTDRSVAEAISAAAGDHGQSVPAYVLSAAHALATRSDGPSVAVARCLPTDALRAVLKERAAPELTNCDTCAHDKPCLSGFRACGNTTEGLAIAAWANAHCDEDGDGSPKPGATGCPGWKPHYQRSPPLPGPNPKPRKKGSTPR